ncbi:MAG: hypothetical protein QM640_13715 [Niabella sp.]
MTVLENISVNITAACRIRHNKVIKNNTVVFEGRADDPDFLQSVYLNTGMNYPRFFKMDTLCKLGTLAADSLLKEADISQYQPEDVGIVLSNSNASIEADIKYFESSKTFPSPSLFVYTLPNIVIGEISIRYGCKGENAFFISEKFNAQLLHFYVTELMQRQHIKACICGWAEVINDEFDACFFLAERKNIGVNFTARLLDNYYYSETIN